mgnify:CR=1 FL=1
MATEKIKILGAILELPAKQHCHPQNGLSGFLCIFQKHSAMATLGLKEMGKFLWSQFSKFKLRQPTGQTFFPIYPKEFSHFFQTQGSQSKVHWENAKKIWYYENWVGHQASFPPRRCVNSNFRIS